MIHNKEIDMQVITVELLNDDALALLRQLEQLNILRLISSDKKKSKPKRLWAGSISKETAIKMLEHTQESRSEWERSI